MFGLWTAIWLDACIYRACNINGCIEGCTERRSTVMANPKAIKPLENYGRAADAGIITSATAVLTGLTGNTNFANPPVDLATFKANIDIPSFEEGRCAL